MKRRLIVGVVGAVMLAAGVWVFLHRGPLRVFPLTTAVRFQTLPVASGGLPPSKSATAAGNSQTQIFILKSNAASAVALSKAPAAFDDFSRWVKDFTNAAANLATGQRLAWKRREAMLDLIQTDPAKAIELSVPFAWRRALPPEITRFFETQVDGRGDFNVAVATDFAQGRAAIYRTVEFGGTKYQAFVYGRRLTQPCKTGIPLHGIALDGKMAVSSDPLRRLSPDEAQSRLTASGQPLPTICSVSGQPADWRGTPVYAESGGGVICFCGMDHYELVNRQWALAESGGAGGFGSTGVAGVGGPVSDAWTHGNKTVLYMRVNFPDDLTEPISATSAYSVMNSVNAFYTDTSYNLTALDPTVAPLVTLPQPKAFYATVGPGQLLADAREATRLAGYDSANYNLDIVAFTSVPGYDFGGLAYVGGKGVWLQSMGAGVTAHELGHNYGLWHANFWNTTTNASMIGPGTNLEYGNIYDTMGLARAGIYQFNAAHKSELDWLKADAVQVITSNGVYRIYPFDVPASARVAGRFYAAAVEKDFTRYYWLEFRRLFTGNPWTQNGVLLNWSPWDGSGGGTQLIDSTPGTPTFSGDPRDDAALVVGRTFNDNAAGVHLTTLARGATGTDPWLDVAVNLGAFPGNQPPAVKIEADETNVAPGALVHFHATAADPDGDALAYAWTFDDLTFSTNDRPWISKTFSASGDHVVRCVVSDMKGGEASANAVVTVGAPGGFRVTGRVTDLDGAPLEGVLVGNGASRAADFIGGWTDSDGRYVIVNVTNDLALSAVQFGHTFTPATNWSAPIYFYALTGDLADADFIGLPLPRVSIAADTNAIAKNDGATHYFTVTRIGGDLSNDLTVQIYLSGTAVLGTDFLLAPPLDPNGVTIPAGSNSVTFAFQAVNNSLVTGPKSVTLTLADDPNYIQPAYALAPLAEATITILGNNLTVAPVVTVATPTPVISENGMDTGQFVFTRAGSLQGDLPVYYSVAGTAAPGADYAPLAGVVVIPNGQSSVTIPLQPLEDHAVGPDKTVVVALQTNTAYALGSPTSATITILDDNLTRVTIAATAGAAKPSASGRFTVKRDGDLTGALVVNYHVSGTAVAGTDYAALPGTVTIPAGAATADIPLTPRHTGVLAGDVSVAISLTNNFNYDVGNPGTATIFIHDDQLPTVTVSAPVASVSEQGSTAGRFTISRGGVVNGNLTVNLAISGTATPGADYLPLDNPATIPDGASSVSLDVISFHDLILEPTEDVVLTLQPGTNYNVGSPATARVSILDDGTSQVPGVGFLSPTSSVVESQSPGIAVGLSVTSTAPVSVDYKVSGGTAPASRYSLPAGTLTIPAGDWTGVIPLRIFNNTTSEPPQTVQVVLFNPVNATLDAIKVHTYTILDDDANAASVTATVPATTPGGPPGNFRIARAGPTNASLLVNFQVTGTASAPTHYAPLGTAATIPAGAAFVDVPVVAGSNPTMQSNLTVVLTLISAPGGTIVSPNQATVTILNTNANPLPVVTVTATNRPCAVEGGPDGAFDFTRTGATNDALTISFAVSGTAVPGVRYEPLPDSVIIPAGQTSVSLPTTAIDDNAVEGEQAVVVSLTDDETYRVAYPSSATVMIQDNDQLAWVDASDFAASKYGPDAGEFTFSRFGTTNFPATIYFAVGGTASNGLDYAAIPNFTVIPAGYLTATLPILPLHNGLVKGPVTVMLTLLTNSMTLQPGNANVFLAAPTNATVTIDDDMPMVTISAVVTNVLEGSGSNGVFRVTRTGDPQYDFTAHLAVGGTATYGLDYPPFPTNVYFTCGVTSIDLFVTPSNNLVAEGDQTVTAALLPDPPYTVRWPSNATLTITDAGTNAAPVVTITNPASFVAFVDAASAGGAGLILGASVTDDSTNYTLLWSKVSGPDSLVFDSTNTPDTAVWFTNAGAYRLRLTADDGQLQGRADILVFVSSEVLSATNLLHWALDESGGTNVNDSSGFGRDGVFDGGPAWLTNGAMGGALQFFGTNDCVRQSAGANTLDGLKAFTVALWLKPPPAISDEGFVTADDSGTNATFNLATRRFASCGNYTNVVEATIPTTGGVIHRASASNALLPGQWQHLAVTWTNGEAPKLYFNGQLDQPDAGFAAVSGVLTNCPQFIIGKGAADGTASWSGALDDVRVFDVALSAEQILALADSPVTNHAPVVDAGTNVTVAVGAPVTLAGTVSDDGLPNPPDQVTFAWSYLGTNGVMIPDPASLTNTLTFFDPGDYTFRLTASDGELSSFADVTVTVITPTRVDVYASGDGYELGPQAGGFYFYRDGATNELTVYFIISGTASNGVDYAALTNFVTFAPDNYYTNVTVTPFLDYNIEGDETVTLTLVTNLAYFIGNGQATIFIHDSPYGLWSIQNFILEQLTHPEVSGPSADFNHDGIANFVEYAFNRDPKATNAAGPPFAWGFETDTNDNQPHLTLTYVRRTPPRDVDYGVYFSTNLLTWNTGSNYVNEFWVSNNLDGATETVKTRAVAPVSATTNEFMTIRVWLQQVPGP